MRYLPKKHSNYPEYQDAGTSSNPEVNKYQDAESNYDTEGPECLDANSSFLPEVTEYHEGPVAEPRYDGNT